jgi:polysaccharide deacetylase family protein (PEP-CTERM system associated)
LLGVILAGVNCAFTVDVEGFAESHVQSVRIDNSYLDHAVMDREIETNMQVILDLLKSHGVRATFFFLGRIARSSPQIVRRTADAGHEIGCHSLDHVRITGQSREEFRRDLRAAKSSLEDVAGTPVIGFRAPDFSIGAGNLWAFDELLEAGFRYDSSVVPTSIHDVYGMTNVPETVFKWPNGLIEFPMPVSRVLGFRIPVGGGGYFRLFPLSWTTKAFSSRDAKSQPATFYIHPYEIGPVAPRLPGLSLARRFRHYVRLKDGANRVRPLLNAVSFGSMAGVLESHGFLTSITPKTEVSQRS